MPTLIHPDFRKDGNAYAEARRFWEALWAGVHPASDWELHWMKNPHLDGNPIFSAVCRSLNKGVRIIQEEPGEANDVDLDWWIDSFGDKNDTASIRELVIACCPSIENSPHLEKLLKKWVQGEPGPLPLNNPAAEGGWTTPLDISSLNLS